MCFWGKTGKGNIRYKSNKSLKTRNNSTNVSARISNNLFMVPYNYQHIGSRAYQEDAFGFSDFTDQKLVKNNGIMAVIADGMGGLAMGDIASQTAVNIFLREYREKEEQCTMEKFLKRTSKISNYTIFDLAYDDSEEDIEIGTTVVAVVIHEGKIYWVSVGDSQIYLYRDNKLKQLNKEHVYSNYLKADVANGLITDKEAEQHPERHALTSYLGLPELHEVEFSEEPLNVQQSDLIILSSDGLKNSLSEKEIIDVISKANGNIAEALVKEALAIENVNQDNITVLALSCN